jgi:hypothetical protein
MGYGLSKLPAARTAVRGTGKIGGVGVAGGGGAAIRAGINDKAVDTTDRDIDEDQEQADSNPRRK